MSTRPRRANANLRPTAVLLTNKQTRRSPAEVAQERAALESQRQALLRKQEEELEELCELEQRLNAQTKENEAHAARPPPAHPTPAKTKTGHSRTEIVEADTVAPSGGSDQPSTERKCQPGRTRRLTQVDVDAHRVPGGLVELSGGRRAAKEKTLPSGGIPGIDSNAEGINGGQKRKAEGGEPSIAKKSKPNKPSGPTAAAAAAFATPASSKRPPQRSQATSPLPTPFLPVALSTATTPIPTSTPSTTASQPRGVYTQTDSIDLDDFEDHSLALVECPVASLNPAGGSKDNVKPAKKNNFIQLEVIDVTANVHIVQGPTTTAAPVPPTPPTPNQPGQVTDAAPAVHAAQARAGQWTMRDLEPILGPYLGNFTHSFVPKLINLVGNHATGPWSLHGLDLKGAMENLAAEVWPTLTIVVIPRQPFFEMAKQKLWEYRNGVGKEAVDVVTAYMTSKRFESPEECADYVNWALSENDNWPFHYERVVETQDNKVKFYGAYQGILVSRALAYHIKRIGLPADQIRDHPCNALALATTAVERALTMWSTGTLRRPRVRSEEAKFSERLWGKLASEYMGSIIDLSDEQWDKILAKAELCMQRLDEDSDDDLDDGAEHSAKDLPTTGRAVLMDAEVEERDFGAYPATGEDI